MAIINTTNTIEWKRVQLIVQEVLLNRKLQFNRQTILPFIKEGLSKAGIDSLIMDCSYFQIIFLNTFDQLIEEGFLYAIDEVYFPVDYIIFHDYNTKYANLFYLRYNEELKPVYYNLDTLERHKTVERRDFLLTGGYDEEKGSLKAPEISLKDIFSLYQNFISEGATKEEAINHILNYYDILKLSPTDYLCNTVIIQEKKKEKNLIRTRKKDNI